MRLRTFGLTILLTLMVPALASAQFIGGGTPDMHGGARGIDQPSFNEGQRSVPSMTPPGDDAEPAAAPAAPPAPAKAKKKRPVKRRAAAKAKPATSEQPAPQ